MLEVPETTSEAKAAPPEDPALATAHISTLLAELAASMSSSVRGDEVIVMRDRVIWMPSVMPVQPPIA